MRRALLALVVVVIAVCAVAAPIKLVCVSRVSENHYATLDNTHITTENCRRDARCEDARIEDGKIVFPGGDVCRIVRAWKEPSN